MKKTIIFSTVLVLLFSSVNILAYEPSNPNQYEKEKNKNLKPSESNYSSTQNTKTQYDKTLLEMNDKILKLENIEADIRKYEKKMEEAGFMIYGGPILAGLVSAVLIFAVKTGNQSQVNGLAVVQTLIVLGGTIISGVGLLQYWDGVNTCSLLRQKRYDFLYNPGLDADTLAVLNKGIFSYTYNIEF